MQLPRVIDSPIEPAESSSSVAPSLTVVEPTVEPSAEASWTISLPAGDLDVAVEGIGGGEGEDARPRP